MKTTPGSDTTKPPQERTARMDSNTVLIYVLAGVAVFLLALVIVVVGARKARELRTQDTLPKAETLGDWIERLRRAPDEKVRQEAAQEIVSRGPKAVLTALNVSTHVTNDALDVPPKVLLVLAGMAPEIVEPLRQGLAPSNPLNVRAGSVAVLRQMGPNLRGADPAVVDSLVVALRDENHWVRCFATDTLGNLGPDAKSGVAGLAKLLSHEDSRTRKRAATALGRIGPTAKEAASALRKLKENDKHRSIRAEAAKALDQVNLDAIAREAAQRATPAVRKLIEELQEGDQHEAPSAAKKLGQMGSDAREAIPALTLALEHRNKWVREAAAEALGEMGSQASSALPALERLSNDEPEVRLAAEKAIDKIEGN